MMFRKLKFASVLLSVCAAAPAFARPEVTTGFPLGEKSRLHTTLDLGVGYDSNPGQLSSDRRVDDWKAHIIPAISVSVPGSSITLDGRAQLSIETYFGTDARESEAAFGGNIMFGLIAGSDDSVVAFELSESLLRTPSYLGADLQTIGAVGAEELTFRQWYNRGEANLVLRPGGGALEFRLGYGNELRLFDDIAQAQKHLALFEAKLRFLPKTAVVFNADLGFYSDDANFKANPYNLSVGLLGQVTQGLTVVAKVGFGDTLTYAEGESFFGTTSEDNIRSIITNLRLEYAFERGVRLAAGYDRAMKQAIGVGVGYASDAPYVKAEIAVGERFSFATLGRVEFRTFADDTDNASTRVFTVDARADYWFFEFLRGGVAYQLLHTDSQSSTAVATIEGGNLPEATRHQVLLTTGVYY